MNPYLSTFLLAACLGIIREFGGYLVGTQCHCKTKTKSLRKLCSYEVVPTCYIQIFLNLDFQLGIMNLKMEMSVCLEVCILIFPLHSGIGTFFA